MSVFAISDLHLPGGKNINKSMEVFGHRWRDHKKRIESSWRAVVGNDDTVVVGGDISWAMTLEDAKDDLIFLDSLPGEKIILEGNHDYWWCTSAKLSSFFAENGISSICILRGDAYERDGLFICGTRGWFGSETAQNRAFDTDFNKLTRREAARLRTSIGAALSLSGGDPTCLRAFLHFPAYFGGEESVPIMEALRDAGVRRVYFGHVHGECPVPRTFEAGGIIHCITSADQIDFAPRLVR